MRAHFLNRMRMTSLSRKMTLFYGGLVVVAIAMILVGMRIGIARYAERNINQEMAAGSAVFDRIATMRYGQMRQAGQVLSADFGFRAAAATRDALTIGSALDNLKRRQGLEQAMLVGTDGTVTGFSGALSDADKDALWSALDAGAQQGLLTLNDRAYSVVAAPVRAPELIGWVVFANVIDARELETMAKLTAIDLKPRHHAGRDTRPRHPRGQDRRQPRGTADHSRRAFPDPGDPRSPISAKARPAGRARRSCSNTACRAPWKIICR